MIIGFVLTFFQHILNRLQTWTWHAPREFQSLRSHIERKQNSTPSSKLTQLWQINLMWQWVNQLYVAIFNSYVELPEGNSLVLE